MEKGREFEASTNQPEEQAEQAHNSPRERELAELLSDVERKFDQLASFDRQEVITSHCDRIEQEVCEAVESAINHLSNIERDLVEKIQLYRERCLKSLKSHAHSAIQKELDAFSGEVRAFKITWNRFFESKDTLANDKRIGNAIAQATQYKSEINSFFDKLSDEVLCEKLVFEWNPAFLASWNHVGDLVPVSSKEIEYRQVSLQNCARHASGVNQITFLTNNLLASCSDEKAIKIWKAANGKELFELRGHTGTVRSLALLPDGCLASGSDDKTIRIWNQESRKCVRTLVGHNSSVTTLHVLPNGFLASSSTDSVIRIWDPISNENNFKMEIKGDFTSFVGVLSSDNLVTCSSGKKRRGYETLQVRDSSTGSLVSSSVNQLRNAKSYLILKDDRIAVGSEDGFVKLIDLNVSNSSRTLDPAHIGAVNVLLQLSNGNLVSAAQDSTLKIWNLDFESLLQTVLTGHTGPITSLGVSIDGLQLATGSEDSTLKIWGINLLSLRDNELKKDDVKSPRVRQYPVLAVIDQDSYIRTLLVGNFRSQDRKIAKEILSSVCHPAEEHRECNRLSNMHHLLATIGALRELNHKRLTRLLDFFDDEYTSQNRLSYLVFESNTEYLSLGHYMSVQTDKPGALLSNTFQVNAMKWLVQISDALAYLHSNHVIHGNLTPNNVFLESESSVKVGVPDLARVFFDSDSVTLESRLDDMRYFSPRRIETGKSESDKDDCWSFGCMLYEIIARKPAFNGLNYSDVTGAILNQEPPKLDDSNYEPLYCKLMEKDENLRLNSKEIKDRLNMLKLEIVLDEENVEKYLYGRKEDPSAKSNLQFIDFNCFNGLEGLKTLDLSHNKFSSIHEDHFECLSSIEIARISRLDLSFNELSIVQDAFWNFITLKTLDLSNNQLEKLPENLFSRLNYLKMLNLSKNKISVLAPRIFESLKNLDSLNLSHNLIKELESGIFNSQKRLQVLILSDNRLEILEPEIFKSQSEMTSLNLSGNKLDSVDGKIFWTNVKLLNLRLDKNQIASIAIQAFSNVTNLRSLDLSFNRMTQIDDSLFSSLDRLKSLNLGSNLIESIGGTGFSSIKKLKELKLNGNELSRLDLTIFKDLTMLKELNLNDNNLSAIDVENWNREESLEIQIAGNADLLCNASLMSSLETKHIMLLYDHIKPIKTVKL